MPFRRKLADVATPDHLITQAGASEVQPNTIYAAGIVICRRRPACGVAPAEQVNLATGAVTYLICLWTRL
jgi:hypothetical protein